MAAMNVHCRLYASLSKFGPVSNGGNSVVRVPRGTTVGGLIDQLRVPVDEIKIIFVNGIHADHDRVLQDGDRVGLFPLVAGG
jgi:molybdopterin converting factor small subunit